MLHPPDLRHRLARGRRAHRRAERARPNQLGKRPLGGGSRTDPMRAWVVRRPSPIDDGPLAFVERDDPHPGPGEVRVRVSVCGVCRTDLHLAEGDLPSHRAEVTPGHEIVGVVDELGRGSHEVRARGAHRDRLAAPHLWLVPLLSSRRREPLPRPPVHGLGRRRWLCRVRRRGRGLRLRRARRVLRRGGGAAAVRRDHRLPGAAPGGVAQGRTAGHLRVRRIGAPRGPGGHVRGRHGPGVHPVGRGQAPRRRAGGDLGRATPSSNRPSRSTRPSCSRRRARSSSPRSRALDRGGTVAVAGIHLSDLPPLRYAEHLFQERQLRSVTANTRDDGRDFLAIAAQIPIRVTTTPYPLAQADVALADLAHDRFAGAAVLRRRRRQLTPPRDLGPWSRRSSRPTITLTAASRRRR